MELVRPGWEHLESYRHALERGWSPDSLRPQAGNEELDEIDADAAGFIASMDDPDGSGPLTVLPDGRQVARLPGHRRWMWDGEFCGTIGLRWQPGTTELPPHCLGHIGYSVVAWKRNLGYATAALRELLPREADGNERVPEGDAPRDERSREEPAPARAQRACGACRVIHPVLWGGREVRVARIRC